MISWGYLCRDAVPTLPAASLVPSGPQALVPSSLPLTFAPLHRPQADLHLGQHMVLSLPMRQRRGIYALGSGFA